MLRLFFEYKYETISLFISFFILFIGGCVSYKRKNAGVALALSLVIIGTAKCVNIHAIKRIIPILFISAGAEYLLLSGIIAIAKKIRERKQTRAEKEKQIQFTLPDKDNEFIKTRLNTVLNKTARSNDTDIKASAKEYSFSYIKKLLALLKSKTLSPADRIKTEEYASLISVYSLKDEWTGEDLQTVNEVLSCVIKLSAKYAV